jgi:hypothetical protein
VTTKTLSQAVKRNQERFPGDFVFLLTSEEKAEVVTKCDHLSKLRFTPGLPHAFTELGTRGKSEPSTMKHDEEPRGTLAFPAESS